MSPAAFRVMGTTMVGSSTTSGWDTSMSGFLRNSFRSSSISSAELYRWLAFGAIAFMVMSSRA